MKCPNCGYEDGTLGALECAGCGVNFEKWAAKKEKELAKAITPPQAPASPPPSPDYLSTAIKIAVAGGLVALFIFGGRSFKEWFGPWLKTGAKNSSAARASAAQSINIPKVALPNLPQQDAGLQNVNLSVDKIYSDFAGRSGGMQQAQIQGKINASLLSVQQNAAASSAIKRYQPPPPLPAGR